MSAPYGRCMFNICSRVHMAKMKIPPSDSTTVREVTLFAEHGDIDRVLW